jgi:hypothetical protein
VDLSGLDEAEYQKLADAVLAAERFAASDPNIRQDAVAAFTQPSKKRLETLERQGISAYGSDDERRKKANDTSAIASMVMQESQLNEQEKETYAGFLHKEYFTKKDFGALADFYADGGAYERLSALGKKHMSERIWAGIERGEFSHGDLPEPARRKDEDQVYNFLQNPETAPQSIKNIRPETRAEFIREYEAGNHDAARKVLSGKDLFEKDSKSLSQAASERSDEAGTAEKLASGEKRETKALDSNIKESDLEKIANISPVDLSIPVASERTI